MLRPARRSTIAALLASVALAGCGTSGEQVPCPGKVQGTFRLRGAVVEGTACAETGGAATALDFSVAVSFVDDATAAVCLQRAMAEPMLGSRSGDGIDVATPARSGLSHGCICAIDVVERLAGTLSREGGVAVGFAGELETTYAPAEGAATCAPSDATLVCNVPCRVRWTLTSG